MRRTVANLTIDNMTLQEALEAIEFLKRWVREYADCEIPKGGLISEKFSYHKDEYEAELAQNLQGV